MIPHHVDACWRDGSLRENEWMEQRPHQFSLRVLLLFVALSAICAALWIQPRRKEIFFEAPPPQFSQPASAPTWRGDPKVGDFKEIGTGSAHE